MRNVVQVDERAQLAGVDELLGGGGVRGKHDVLPADAERFAEHQLGVAGAIHAAAVLMQELEDRGIGAGLDRVVLFIARIPGKCALEAVRRTLDALFVVDVEGGGIGLDDLLDLSLGIGQRLHGCRTSLPCVCRLYGTIVHKNPL